MKRMIILLLFMISLAGCHDPSKFALTSSFNIQLSENSKTDSYELFRADKNYLYISSLNTLDNPFLFSTNEIIITSLEGQIEKQFSTKTGKRIVDFVIYNDENFYLNLVEDKKGFNIELCKLELNNQEKIIKKYQITDPFSYPRFIFVNNQYYFKVENELYTIEGNKLDFENNKEFFLPRHNLTNKDIYFKIVSDKGYELYCYDNNKVTSMDFSGNFGNFEIVDNKVIYDNNDDKYLYIYDVNTKKRSLLYNQAEVFDFLIIKDKVIVSCEGKLVEIDIKTGEIEQTINKEEGIIGWLYSNGENVYMHGTEKIFKLGMN